MVKWKCSIFPHVERKRERGRVALPLIFPSFPRHNERNRTWMRVLRARSCCRNHVVENMRVQDVNKCTEPDKHWQRVNGTLPSDRRGKQLLSKPQAATYQCWWAPRKIGFFLRFWNAARNFLREDFFFFEMLLAETWLAWLWVTFNYIFY